ncbi:uncharacterized protein LOC124944406 [Impatiens glandulifera]|uniref:uncharacterized protein LOC124944406 n=1 Tax=Impatiens glandulifera TaxID=253017 RepID=UPI001FB110FB|nr:uncharacterized protein LOC124944406 [Impatiens glandulifera]
MAIAIATAMAWVVSVDSLSVPSSVSYYTKRDKELCIRRWANRGHSSSSSEKNTAAGKKLLIHSHYKNQRANSNLQLLLLPISELHYEELSFSSNSTSSIILGFWVGPDIDDDGWGFIDAIVDRIS